MKKTEEISQMKNLISTCLSNNLNNEKAGDKSVFFGTGLASSQAPSLGFGIDILGTILTSLKVKRILGAKEVLHLISTTGYNISEDTKENIVKKQEEIIQKIVLNLGIQNEYRLICSSNFIETPRFLEIKSEIEHTLSKFNDAINFDQYGSYTILQTSICKYLYEKEKVILKTGWCVRDTSRPLVVSKDYIRELIECGHLNELYFDEIYRYVYPEDEYSFIYTPPAIGLDGRCSPPYTVTENDNRPLIDENIDLYVNTYIGNMQETRDSRKKFKKSIENWRKTIIEPYEDLFGKIIVSEDISNPQFEILKKLSAIQKEILQDIDIEQNIKIKNITRNTSNFEIGGI